jgi:hypothetical protein
MRTHDPRPWRSIGAAAVGRFRRRMETMRRAKLGSLGNLGGAALVLAATLLVADQAAADRVLGLYLGTFSGNDSEEQILIDLGLEVVELAKVEIPDLSNAGLTLSMIMYNDDVPPEPISGWWDYDGSLGTVDLLVVKAGNQYAAFQYDDIITNNQPNLGLWDTTQLGNKGLSHVTGYNIVPEPATAALVALGLALLGSARPGRN